MNRQGLTSRQGQACLEEPSRTVAERRARGKARLLAAAPLRTPSDTGTAGTVTIRVLQLYLEPPDREREAAHRDTGHYPQGAGSRVARTPHPRAHQHHRTTPRARRSQYHFACLGSQWFLAVLERVAYSCNGRITVYSAAGQPSMRVSGVGTRIRPLTRQLNESCTALYSRDTPTTTAVQVSTSSHDTRFTRALDCRRVI